MAARILVVEDEAPLRQILVEALEDSGYEVVSVSDGEAALKAVASSGPFDLLLLDDALPLLRGLEALARLRAAGASTPALFLSGHMAEKDPRAEALGAAVLSKPVRLDTLLGAVREALALVPNGP